MYKLKLSCSTICTCTIVHVHTPKYKKHLSPNPIFKNIRNLKLEVGFLKTSCT